MDVELTHDIEVGIVPIEEVIMKDRARKDLGDLSHIKESAKGFAGQIQSLAVCRRADGKYDLLAGGRRLTALRAIHKKVVAVRIYPESTTIEERKTIELVENLARLDLSWQEQVALTKEIHDHQTTMHGHYYERDGDDDTSETWSKEKTGKLLGRAGSMVSRDIKLAEAVELIPELKQCKTKKDARNVLALAEENNLKAELAKRATTAQSVSLAERYIVGDFFHNARSILQCDDRFDVIDCDPPYGIDFSGDNSPKHQQRDNAKAEDREFHGVAKSDFGSFIGETISICYDLLKPNGWLILWHAPDMVTEIWPLLHDVGFRVARPAVWVKNAPGFNAGPDSKLSAQYEPFFYCRKGEAILQRRGIGDVFTHSRPSSKYRIHPTEKPVSLLTEVFKLFGAPSAKMLVPFLGSGNALIAANECGFNVKGFDLSQEYKNAFIAREARRGIMV